MPEKRHIRTESQGKSPDDLQIFFNHRNHLGPFFLRVGNDEQAPPAVNLALG